MAARASVQSYGGSVREDRARIVRGERIEVGDFISNLCVGGLKIQSGARFELSSLRFEALVGKNLEASGGV